MRTKQLVSLAVGVCICMPGAFAANGSVAAAMVKDAWRASILRSERQSGPDKVTCDAAQRDAGRLCGGGGKPQPAKVKKT